MQTTKNDLTDEAWVELGTAPCLLQSVATPALPVPCAVAFVIADAAPLALDAPAFLLSAFPVPVTQVGKVFARALNARGARVVSAR